MALNIFVLSAHDADNDAFIEACQSFQPQSMIFTKLDETDTAGHIFNVLHQYPIPLSYFGIGRHCDADFEVASAERLVSLLFRIENAGNEKEVIEEETGEFKPLSFLQGAKLS